MNLILLKGYLGKSPETRMAGTVPVSKFSLATTRPTKKDPITDWHQVEAWDKLSEFAQKYLSKGQEVLVQGQVQYGSYEKDGVTRYTTTIRADRIEFCGKKDASAKPEVTDTPAPSTGTGETPPADADMDIPF